jgi:hypothetical protein
MIHFKSTVSFNKLHPAIVLALHIANEIWSDMGYSEVWITSANDGNHAGKPVVGEELDPHYTGRAVDIRIKSERPVDIQMWSHRTKDNLVARLKLQLEPQYVVIWESKETDNEHVHIQYGHIAV